MPVPSHVARRLREVLGADAAEDLVNWMDETTAVRADVAELRHEMQVGFARLEANFGAQGERTRADLATQIERVRGDLTAQIERSKADLMKWSFVFWCGAVAAIAALAGVFRG
ncbi:MAG: hypothetical protein WD801_16885 [Gemmatimonadaceae bacterium]